MDDMKFKEHLTSNYDKQAYKKYNALVRGANIRSMPFRLNFKEYLPFYHQPCFYCGACRSNGLDRLDSSIGYEKGNIVSCCTACNVMKGILSPKDFIFQCKKISEYCVSIPENYEPNIFVPQKTVMLSMVEHEKEMVRNCLDKYSGNRTKASRELGISTTTLWRKIKKYGIEAIISH